MANPASNANESMTSLPNPLFIGGPTAVGKSAFALELAERIGGEIISVDSMQVYRGLNIGTAKPSPEERARVRHHLIDVCELNEPFDAAQFVRLAGAAVADIRSRQHIPIFCGGTGLYFRGYLEGLGTSPATDAALRAELERQPLESLLGELERSDPVAFAQIDKKNPRRVVRAIEVIRLTGKPFSAQRAEWKKTDAMKELEPATPVIFCFQRERLALNQRIDARVELMFENGLVAETKSLLTRGLTENKTAMQAIGYRQVVEHLNGERGLAETIELVKARTRQFAKRQITWFRAQRNVKWIEWDDAKNFASIREQIGTA